MAHWADTREAAGSVWQMKLVYRLYRVLGLSWIRLLLHVIVFFFFAFAPAARRISRSFLSAVAAMNKTPAPTLRQVYRHFYCFSFALLEKISAWARDIKAADLVPRGPDLDALEEQLRQKRGAVILCSHLGNTEMLRALGSTEAGRTLPDFGIHSIVEFSGTARFNRLLAEINPASMVRLISAAAVGPDTVIGLADSLSRGDLVIIAADRTAAGNRGKTLGVRFLGRAAQLPIGAFVLAQLLGAPLYHMFAVRRNDLDMRSPYEFYVFKSVVPLTGGRRERMMRIRELMNEYITHLEALCRLHPYQWYNFFDFWDTPAQSEKQRIPSHKAAAT